MLNDENYPRSKGLFLSLPHRQTMVLLTDSTIRELCSSTTPTSQFSSLHFIASTAIGEKSIETRAQTLHGEGEGCSIRVSKDGCGKTPAWASRRSFWRKLAASRQREFSIHTAAPTVTIWLPERRSWRRPPRLAQRWVATEHAPLPLPYCVVMGIDPALRKPFVIVHGTTVICIHFHLFPYSGNSTCAMRTTAEPQTCTIHYPVRHQ